MGWDEFHEYFRLWGRAKNSRIAFTIAFLAVICAYQWIFHVDSFQNSLVDDRRSRWLAWCVSQIISYDAIFEQLKTLDKFTFYRFLIFERHSPQFCIDKTSFISSCCPFSPSKRGEKYRRVYRPAGVATLHKIVTDKNGKLYFIFVWVVFKVAPDCDM